ncbi:hypothetical protein, partial [Desulfocucumis palustris]|uniref:hypothetical protein n=1 Tax=Desulfocucumis palustris TaxID=1898651 RepID=UPI001A9A54E4
KDLLHKDLKNFRKLYVGVRIRDACIAGRPRGEWAVGYAVSHWAIHRQPVAASSLVGCIYEGGELSH